jgi:hypothetical protein
MLQEEFDDVNWIQLAQNSPVAYFCENNSESQFSVLFSSNVNIPRARVLSVFEWENEFKSQSVSVIPIWYSATYSNRSHALLWACDHVTLIISTKINFANACYYSLRKLLSSRPLFKSL